MSIDIRSGRPRLFLRQYIVYDTVPYRQRRNLGLRPLPSMATKIPRLRHGMTRERGQGSQDDRWPELRCRRSNLELRHY